MKRLRQNELLRQGGAYGVVGGIQLVLDWMTYVVLTHFGLEVALANVLARAGGAAAGFALNGAFTFRGSEGVRLGWRRFSRYALTWSLTALISTLVLVAVDEQASLQASWLAKPVIDAALAVLGFVASRYWIYR